MAEASFCRLCAEQKETFLGIYEEEGLKLMLESKITKCLQIELFLKDPLPKIVCLDCCAKLNQCSDFFDASAEAQVALHMLFQQPKEEDSTISGDQDTETQSEEFLRTFSSQRDRLESDNSYHEETEAGYDQLENRSSLLVNSSTGSDDPDGPYCSKRKRRMPLRWVLQLKGANKEELPAIFPTPDIPSLDTAQTESVQRSFQETMETLDKNCTEVMQTTDLLPVRPCLSDEEQIPTAADTVGDISQNVDGVEENPRKRRDGWEKYPWMCTDCSQELPSMQALRAHHQNVHNQPPRFMCAQCSKVYTKYYGFVSHVRRHRNHMKFCCEECGKCFSNKKVLESHRATHSDARPFVCNECGKSFRQQSALYVHNRSHMPESVKNRYPCDQCDKRFSTKPNLVTHKRIHTGIRNFTCDQCGKSFIQKGNLDAHLLTHSADKPHLCPVCNKGFKTPLQLRKHQTVHTGAKPHQCDVCGRQFRERGTLREHHRIHTGAMPFTCEFCGKSFRFKGILTTHRRQHTGERPYSCLECQHHFTNWPNYNKHMKRRHGINTSHQPDPNKIALANMAAVNAAGSGNITDANNEVLVAGSTPQQNTPTATMLVIQHQQSLHPDQHPQSTAGTEHCPGILSLSSELIEQSPLTSGTASVQFNHHAGTDALPAHGTACAVGAGESQMLSPERLGAHFYAVAPPAPSAPPPHVYVSSAAVAGSPQQANVLGFYTLPHHLVGLETPPLDMLSPLQQR